MGGGSSAGSTPIEAPNSLVSDSLLKITDLLCEGPISGFALTSGAYGTDPLTSTYFNDVVCRNADGTYNINVSGQGFQFSYTLGTSGQLPMSGFEYVTCQLPLPPDTRLSYPPTNAGSPKAIIVTFNTNQYPDANSILVNFKIPAMYATDNAGDTNGFEIDTEVYIGLNSQPLQSLGNQQFVGKNTTPYFRTYQYTLPITNPPSSFYQWTLAIYKTSQDVQSVQVSDDIYVDSVEVISASQYTYPNSVLAGVYVDALQFGSVPSRAYMIQGMLVSVPSGYTPTTYDPNHGTGPYSPAITPAVYPEVWNGTFVTGVWTDNPAWIFYDMVTNTRYGLGQYINTANIDIWTLYQVSQYCDQMVDNGQGNGLLEPQFTCNAFIRSADDAYSMLLNLASTFRGMLYYANGTIRANTTDNKTPVFNYTNANVINGVFNYSSTARNARHNAVQVKYSDPQNLFRDNYVLIEDNQGIIQYGYNKKEIAAFGCSSIGQATRVANWILATERLRTETVTFEVGEDGLYVRPGDVFNLYDNYRTNKSQGGRIASFDSTQQFVTLDRPVNLDSGVIYALTCLVPALNYDTTTGITGSTQIPLIRNPQIQSCEVLDANLSGVTTVQVTGGFSGLMKNAIWILSASGVYTSGYVPTYGEVAPQYECLAITESSQGILGVIALNYNTGINYTINTGFTTIMNPINIGNDIAPLSPTNFTGQFITGALSNGSYYQYFNLTWSPSLSSTISSYVLSGDAGFPGLFVTIGTTTTTGFRYIPSVTGNMDFKVASVGKGGAVSAPQSLTFDFPSTAGLGNVDRSGIRFWLLPDGFGDLEQIAVLYNRPSPPITNTNIYYATGHSAPFNQVLDMSVYAVEGTSLSGLSSSGTTAYLSSSSYDLPTIASQSAGQQAANSLLFLLDNEVMSVGGWTGLVAPNQYAFSMSRGVLGTFATAHSSGTSGWLFYSVNLPSFSRSDIVNVFNGTGYDTGVATRYFQIQNNTATLDGYQIPPTPGIAYVLPNPTPAAPTNLTATVGTGKIVRLAWTMPNNTDILEYRIYRATGPGYSDTALIGTSTDVTLPTFDDINVVLGTTYEYRVTTVAQNEEESPLSTSVFATPLVVLPSGINPYPPADPSAATLSSSGIYYAIDGTKLSFLAFSIPGQPSGSAYTNLLYQKHGAASLSGAQLGAQISATGTTIATLYDLTPNISYDVGTQAVSNFGYFSPDITTAAGSPYVAPTGAVLPAAPVGLAAVVGSFNGVSLTWTANTEPDIAEYGIYRSTTNTFVLTNSIGFASSTSYIDANVSAGTTYYYWLTAIDTSDNISPASSSVSAVPFNTSTGVNLASLYYPPAPAGTPTSSSSNVYLASDGSLLANLAFAIPALTSGAAYQNLLYGNVATTPSLTGLLIGAQVFNSGSASNVSLFDLTPGASYYIALNSVSSLGISQPYPPSLIAGGTVIAPSTPSAPATPVGLIASGGLGGTANFIALHWTPNTESNLEEYGIYKSIVNSTPASPTALVSSNSYIDGTVTGGFTYYYWLSAYNRSQVQSALTSSVSASTENPPSAPTAPTLGSDGTYLSADGNTFSYLAMNLSAIPSGAVGQYLLYRLDGGANWTVGSDLNNVSTASATINDLTPGVVYDVGVQAYSLNGIATSVVNAVGSPFTAPVNATAPNPPTNLISIAAAANGMFTAPVVYNTAGGLAGSIVPASILSWTLSTSSGLAFYEITWGSSSSPPPSTPVPLNQSAFTSPTLITVLPSVQQAPVYSSTVFPAGFAWARAVDKFGNASTWSGMNNNGNTTYAGNMGIQSYTGVTVLYITGNNANINGLTGNNGTINTLSSTNAGIGTAAITTAAITTLSATTAVTPSLTIGPSSNRPILIEYILQFPFTITGFASTVNPAFVQVPIPSTAGFPVKPDTCMITLNDSANFTATYSYASHDTTSTNARVQIWGNGFDVPTGVNLFTGSLDFILYT